MFLSGLHQDDELKNSNFIIHSLTECHNHKTIFVKVKKVHHSPLLCILPKHLLGLNFVKTVVMQILFARCKWCIYIHVIDDAADATSLWIQYRQAAMYLSNGKCNNARNEVARCTPHHKCITNTWKYKTSQHLAWVRIVLRETHAMQQYKEHQWDDWETFDNAAKWRFWTSLVAEQYEIDCCCFEEWHQLWTNTFEL